MIHVAIIDQDGKTVSPNELASAAELRSAAEQASSLSRNCEHLAKLKDPKALSVKQGNVPYLS